MSEQNFNPNLTQMAQMNAQAAQQPTPQQPVQTPQGVYTQQAPVVPTQQTVPHQYGQQIVQGEVPQQQSLRPSLPASDDFIRSTSASTGVVVDNASLVEKEPPYPGELNVEQLDTISQYMQETEQEYQDLGLFDLQKKMEAEAAGVAPEAPAADLTKAEEDEEKDPEELAKELEDKYNKAIIVIDKLNAGALQLTPEEREKLERVKKIRIEEVETVNIKKFKTKKSKKNNLENVLKRQPAVNTTQIVLPASGYTAAMNGASTYELISLMQSSDNALIDTETKWSVLHSKLASTSIGKLDFNEFLRATASVDYNTLVYGLLCSTYPDDDKLPLQCANPSCDKTFEHEYQVRGLLRAEKMTEKLTELIVKTIDGSHTEESAKQVHGEAAVSQTKTIVLPQSGYVLDIYIQSAHELLYNSIKGLTENQEEKYNQASVLSTIVKTAYIPDPDSNPEDPEYFEYSDAIDITKIIYNLQDTDILVLSKQSELLLEDISFDFGLMNVQCPHCGHYREEVPFDIESILFYRYQQAMNTTVE